MVSREMFMFYLFDYTQIVGVNLVLCMWIYYNKYGCELDMFCKFVNLFVPSGIRDRVKVVEIVS